MSRSSALENLSAQVDYSGESNRRSPLDYGPSAGWWKIFFKGEGGFVSFFKYLKLLDAAFRILSLFVVAEFSPSVTTSYFILLIQESVKKLEENIADFGRISENLLSKFGKVIYIRKKVNLSTLSLRLLSICTE